ncbi:hypothetical protein Tco_1544904 [Tanacetum coccineum]
MPWSPLHLAVDAVTNLHGIPYLSSCYGITRYGVMPPLTKEPKDHRKSKHIERKYHFVRSKVEEGHMIVKHIRSEDNPADLFTKALAKSRHDEHARSIGLKDNIKF